MNEVAKRDGIRTTRDIRGRIVYHVPCISCGEDVERKAYRGKENNLCDYCRYAVTRKIAKAKYDEILKEKSKAEIRFEKAIEEIKSQVRNFEEYQKPIEIAKKRVEKYASIPEAMVAIELIRLKYSITPQQKAGKYRVDFAIPKEKFIVEVDGSVYHQKMTEREAKIQLMFGLDWKMIHIPAEKIRKNIRKLGRIMKIYESKSRLIKGIASQIRRCLLLCLPGSLLTPSRRAFCVEKIQR